LQPPQRRRDYDLAMRCARRSPVLFALAGFAMLFVALSLWAGTTTHSKYAGIYQSEPKEDLKPGEIFPSMSVSLGTDGSATVTQDTGSGAVTFFGHWSDQGSQVLVTFDPGQAKAPATMVFQPSHDGLQAVTWDHVAWGKANPPLMKKGESNWHSKGKHSWL
jgi:hypothetical protein